MEGFDGFFHDNLAGQIHRLVGGNIPAGPADLNSAHRNSSLDPYIKSVYHTKLDMVCQVFVNIKLILVFYTKKK